MASLESIIDSCKELIDKGSDGGTVHFTDAKWPGHSDRLGRGRRWRALLRRSLGSPTCPSLNASLTVLFQFPLTYTKISPSMLRFGPCWYVRAALWLTRFCILLRSSLSATPLQWTSSVISRIFRDDSAVLTYMSEAREKQCGRVGRELTGIDDMFIFSRGSRKSGADC